MSTKASQRVLEAREDALFVAASSVRFQDLTTAELTRLYAQVLEEGEPMPDFAHQQELDVRLLRYCAEQLAAADRERLEAIDDSTQGRTDSQDVADSVRLSLHGLKHRIIAAYGRPILRALGLASGPARKPPAVLQQADNLQRRLRDPELELPAPKPGRRPIVPDALAAELDHDLSTLREAVEELRTSRRRGEQALMEKHRALDRARRQYVGVTRQIEARYRLAGLDEAARRLRRRTFNRTPTPDAEPPTEPDGPTPSPIVSA